MAWLRMVMRCSVGADDRITMISHDLAGPTIGLGSYGYVPTDCRLYERIDEQRIGLS